MSEAPTEVEKDGQKLTHTTAPEVRRRRKRRPEPPTDKTAEGDDPMRRIVERHASDDELGADDSAVIPTPEVEFVAEDGEDMPPEMEPEPRKRRGATVEEMDGVAIGATLDEIPPPRNFEDLMRFDLGERWHIHVDRRAPKTLNGNRIDGAQIPIERKMKDVKEFARVYGGLEYELTVYGPPKRGEQIDPSTGAFVKVPRSKPIKLTVSGAPANPDTCAGRAALGPVEEDDMDSSASGFTRTRPGVANNADARIHETNLEHEREMDARAERRHREERDAARQARAEREKERERQERERESREASAADAFARMHQSSMESQRDLLKVAMTQFGGRPGAGEEEKRYLHEALRELQSTNQEYINRLQENHAAALERIQNQHRSELERSETQHRAEINRLQDQVVAERTRCDQIVRDSERQHNDRSREAEARATKEIEQVRRESTERIDALRREQEARREDERSRHADRHQDLKDAHDRELRARDSKWESQLASERAGFDSRMAVKEHELKLLREENARLRRENEKPIHERVREITETAEALGMKRAEDIPAAAESEDLTWQQILLRMGGDAVQNLPAIISSASEAVGRLRSGGTPAQQAEYVRMQQQQMAQGAAAHPLTSRPAAALPFAIDGENDFQPPAAVPQMAYPTFPTAVPPPMTAPPVAAAAAPTAPVMPDAQPIAPAPTPSMPPQADGAPPAAQPAPASNGATDVSMDPVILENAEPFEKAMASGATPAEVASYLAEKVPKPFLSEILKVLSPELVRAALQRNGRAASPLCRRDGQKFLRAVAVELDKIMASPS